MIDVNALKGIIVANGLTQGEVAKEIGVTQRTFTEKMKHGVFKSNEIEAMVNLLGITDIPAIFFKH